MAYIAYMDQDGSQIADNDDDTDMADYILYCSQSCFDQDNKTGIGYIPTTPETDYCVYCGNCEDLIAHGIEECVCPTEDTKIISLAHIAQNSFRTLTVDENRHPDGFIYIKKESEDDCPEWVASMVKSVHNEMEHGLPDDYIYEYIVNTLDIICEENTASVDTVYQIMNEQSEEMTGRLLTWLCSHSLRREFLNEVVNEGIMFDQFELSTGLKYAQRNERVRVAQYVMAYIQKMAK